MSKRVWLTVAFMVLLPAHAHAYIGLCCGKCGGNMPMNIPGGGIPETYEFRAKIQPMFMHMQGLRSGTGNVDGSSLLGMPVMMGKPTGKFMAVPESMDMYMTNLSLGYSFSDKFFGGVMLMYKDNRMPMRFSSMMRTMTGQSGYTMKSDGMADTMLMAKYRLYADDPMIPSSETSLFMGLSLPTGSIDARNTTHPLAVRRTELLPYGMQLGSGTVDPTIGMLYQHSVSPWWWGVNATYTARLYDNRRNYRLGNVAKLDGYLMHQLSYNFLVQAQLNMQWRGRIHGQADEYASGYSGHATHNSAASPAMTPLWNPANYGGTKAYATLGVQWQPKPLHILDLSVQLPVYQRLNGVQLKDQYGVMFTWYMEFPTSKSVRHLTADHADPELGF
ncbi:MAG TPA: transporter [Mariprofundaceae bacterium]|nr:transporter [Mariprofundaceae bacterium]